MFEKIIKNEVKINPSSARKFFYVIRTDKERKIILDEATYYKKIYDAVDDNILLEVVIEKYIKMKIYNRKYFDIKNDVDEYKKYLESIYCDVI